VNIGKFRVQRYSCAGCSISWFTEDMDVDGSRFCPVCGDPMNSVGLDGYRLVPEPDWKSLKQLRYGYEYRRRHHKDKQMKRGKLVCFRRSCRRRARGLPRGVTV
jgi:hypothetical protein